MDKTYLIIPAYNESEAIQQVLKEWYPVVERCGQESRLVVIDDGSKDNTYAILTEFARTHPQVVAMTKANSGHGATILHGYRYALQQGAEYIFQTDSDGQTDPAEFPAFWEQRKKYDMVIGYRNKRQDGLSRILVTKVLKLVILLCFGANVKDANTPFRLMRAETLAKYMDLIPEDYFLTNVLISVIYQKKRCRVRYMPITFRPRQGGVNSINMKRIQKIGRQAWHDFRVIRKSIDR